MNLRILAILTIITNVVINFHFVGVLLFIIVHYLFFAELIREAQRVPHLVVHPL